MEAKNNNKNSMNVIENTENEVQVTEESRKAYGRPSINEEKGWKLDHVIPFNFYHNAYIKSRASIDELVNMVLQECNIKPDDTCSYQGVWLAMQSNFGMRLFILPVTSLLIPLRRRKRNTFGKVTGRVFWPRIV